MEQGIAAAARSTHMVDPSVYLEKLCVFSRLLRLKGIPVGFTETADAARILTEIGFADRETVKEALRTVFACSREEQLAFDSAFDGFFLSEEAIRAQAQQQMQQEQELKQRRQKAEKELEEVGEQAGLDARQRETYMTMPEDVRQRLKNFAERYKSSMERNPGLYNEFIHSVFAKSILEQQLLSESAGENCMEMDPEVGILYRDLGDFRDAEIPKAIHIIQDIAKQINGELSSKKKRASHSTKLNFRRTIRKGLETGGTFRTLHYQKKREHRKRLVILCDVSGSMIQFSEFALRFIQSLNQVSDSSRVFLFSEQLTEADAYCLHNMDLFRTFVRDSGIYGRGTDLGTALEKMIRMRPPVLTQGTTLLILSDTKTIDQGRAIAAVLEAKRQSGRVLWLNPIPEGKWQYLRSVQTMADITTMVSCSTLRELANACKRLARI